MANKEKLPWELMEDILSRVPPKPLVRFKTVCKRWNTLFGDKTFINNHKMSTFQFILVTKSKIYSVSLNPEIEVIELSLDIPGLICQTPDDLDYCNELLLFAMDKGAVVCNPWLGKTRRIQAGYAWKDLVLEEPKQGTPRSSSLCFHSTRAVSLNGSLYWVAHYVTHPTFVIFDFSFSSESFSIFCDLPCGNNDLEDALVLRVYRGLRFSLLKQCHVTKKINIWVTKNNIASGYHIKVKWRSFMEVSIPNLPDLVQIKCYSQPSYFIDGKRNDKKLVVCSCDVNGWTWIYVLAEKEIQFRKGLIRWSMLKALNLYTPPRE
ncbi:hypothetical protein Bca4012_063123 [Brassica carinata]